MPQFDLPTLNKAIQRRLEELQGGTIIITIPCGKEPDGPHHGIVAWSRLEDGALITHRFFVPNGANTAQLESGDYYMPGRLTPYQAIAKACERATTHID